MGRWHYLTSVLLILSFVPFVAVITLSMLGMQKTELYYQLSWLYVVLFPSNVALMVVWIIMEISAMLYRMKQRKKNKE